MNKRILVIGILCVVLLFSVSFFVFLKFPFNKSLINGEYIAIINGEYINKSDFLKTLHNASSLGLQMDQHVFLYKVLEDMINAELLFQEAKKRYGNVEKYDGINRIMELEIRSKQSNYNSNIIENKKNELKIYQEYMKRLRRDATIVINEPELSRTVKSFSK